MQPPFFCSLSFLNHTLCQQASWQQTGTSCRRISRALALSDHSDSHAVNDERPSENDTLCSVKTTMIIGPVQQGERIESVWRALSSIGVLLALLARKKRKKRTRPSTLSKSITEMSMMYLCEQQTERERARKTRKK